MVGGGFVFLGAFHFSLDLSDFLSSGHVVVEISIIKYQKCQFFFPHLLRSVYRKLLDDYCCSVLRRSFFFLLFLEPYVFSILNNLLLYFGYSSRLFPVLS